MRPVDADTLLKYIPSEDMVSRLAVLNAPTIEPMRKKGKWIDTGSMEEWWAEEFMCSECGWSMLGTANFCYNCGSYNGGDNNG